MKVNPEIHAAGPFNDMREPDPAGSYVRIGIHWSNTDTEFHYISRGEAEDLIAELQAIVAKEAEIASLTATVEDELVTMALLALVNGRHKPRAGQIRDVIAAVAPALRAEGARIAEGRRWVHVKRGTVYTEVGRASLQCAEGTYLGEGHELVIYRGDDGKLWARGASEFEDGRFVEQHGEG